MLKNVFHGRCGVLLALCVLTAVLWLGSHRSLTAFGLPVSAGGTRLEVTSYRGLLAVFLTQDYPAATGWDAVVRRDDEDIAARWDMSYWADSVFGFSADDRRALARDGSGEFVECRSLGVTMPYGPVLIVLALLPLWRLVVELRAYRRIAAGRCATCGYDLHHMIDVCPACAALMSVMPPPTASPRLAAAH
jgi:hypothetical protein